MTEQEKVWYARGYAAAVRERASRARRELREAGNPSCPIIDAWMDRFGLKSGRPNRDFPARLLNQLSHCKSDDARRVILGISE